MEALTRKKLAALVLCTNEKHFLDDCLGSLREQSYPNLVVYLLDNHSSDGSPEYVRRHYPEVRILSFSSNLGYSKANNNGMVEAFRDGADFCLILNSDIRCSPDMVEQLVNTYERQQLNGIKTGLIQPVVRLFDAADQLNTVGNAIHYLGFGYCKDYKKLYTPLPEDRPIISASGAAMLVSRTYYEDIGLINEDFFIYNEDQNYSWRGLLKGYQHFVSAKAEMLHKYRFKSYPFKFYHSEKNRLMILLENYETKTLLLLSPVLLLNEGFMLGYALLNKWFFKKLRSWWYVATHLKHIRSVRKQIQTNRSLRDRDLIRRFDPAVEFEATDSFATRHIVNPIFRLYYRLLLKVL